MSNFNYSQYQEVIARAQSGSEGNSVKVGFFKMKNDKDEALVRFNISSLNDLQFATVHQLGAAQRWMKVSCLNPVGSYQDTCPLCAAVAGGAKDIGKATKKVYVQMMVSYKDATTGQFAAAIPVIWERPAGFSREIANLLNDYGDLKARVFKVTRNGVANSMQTTYSISYIPLYDKPESVTEDLSAFNNFNIAKHSYWEKTPGDINVFLNTGSFPEVARAPQAPMPNDADAPAYTKPVYQPPVTTESYAPATPTAPAYQAPVAPAYQPPVQPAPQPVAPTFVPGITTTPAVEPAAPVAPVAPTAPQAPAMPSFAIPTAPAPAQAEGQPNGFDRAPRTFNPGAFKIAP